MVSALVVLWPKIDTGGATASQGLVIRSQADSAGVSETYAALDAQFEGRDEANRPIMVSAAN